MRHVTLSTPRAQARLLLVMDAMEGRQMTAAQIADAVHISRRWIYPYLEALMAGAKKIYVASWGANAAKGDRPPVYALGSRRDARKPPALTWAQKAKAERKRVNADPDRRDRHLAKRRARRMVAKQDPLVAALFGQA